MTVKSFLGKFNPLGDTKEFWMMENGELAGIIMNRDILLKGYDYCRFEKRKIDSFMVWGYKMVVYLK